MADKGYVKTQLNAIRDGATQRAVELAFTEALDNFSRGAVADKTRATNGQRYFFSAITSSVANQEFSIHHGQGQAPLSLVPILPLDSSGVSFVTLTTTRPADSQRVYLRSPSTSVTIFCEVGF